MERDPLFARNREEVFLYFTHVWLSPLSSDGGRGRPVVELSPEARLSPGGGSQQFSSPFILNTLLS